MPKPKRLCRLTPKAQLLQDAKNPADDKENKKDDLASYVSPINIDNSIPDDKLPPCQPKPSNPSKADKTKLKKGEIKNEEDIASCVFEIFKKYSDLPTDTLAKIWEHEKIDNDDVIDLLETVTFESAYKIYLREKKIREHIHLDYFENIIEEHNFNIPSKEYYETTWNKQADKKLGSFEEAWEIVKRTQDARNRLKQAFDRAKKNQLDEAKLDESSLSSSSSSLTSLSSSSATETPASSSATETPASNLSKTSETSSSSPPSVRTSTAQKRPYEVFRPTILPGEEYISNLNEPLLDLKPNAAVDARLYSEVGMNWKEHLWLKFYKTPRNGLEYQNVFHPKDAFGNSISLTEKDQQERLDEWQKRHLLRELDQRRENRKKLKLQHEQELEKRKQNGKKSRRKPTEKNKQAPNISIHHSYHGPTTVIHGIGGGGDGGIGLLFANPEEKTGTLPTSVHEHTTSIESTSSSSSSIPLAQPIPVFPPVPVPLASPLPPAPLLWQPVPTQFVPFPASSFVPHFVGMPPLSMPMPMPLMHFSMPLPMPTTLPLPLPQPPPSLSSHSVFAHRTSETPNPSSSLSTLLR